VRFAAYPSYKPSGVEWLGNVPEHWGIAQLRRFTRFITSGSRGWAEYYTDEGALFIRIGNLTRNSIRVDLSDLQHVDPPPGAEGERTRVAVGDVLFSITAYLGSVGVADESIAGAYINQHIALVRLHCKMLAPRFVAYATLADVGQTQLTGQGYGGTKIQLALDDVKSLWFPYPSLAEQHAIAAFLDHQTAKIDTLVAKKRALIERLKEKRTALISRTVTRGLPSDAAHAAGLDPHPRFKPSGIDWLGDVPEHWEVKRLRFVSPHITVGIVVEPSKYYEDEGVPCLRSLNVRANALVERDLVYISPESNRLLAKSMLRKGDLVAVRSGQPGTTAVIDDRFDGANCIDLIIIRRSKRADSTFLSHYLNSSTAQAQFTEGTGGAIQQHFNIGTAADLWVVQPRLSEQLAIADFLDRETAKIDQMVAKVETAIERLQEYRTALITAAVTGKIDVRRAVA
jgi:type I restriction enzyme, S subunit